MYTHTHTHIHILRYVCSRLIVVVAVCCFVVVVTGTINVLYRDQSQKKLCQGYGPQWEDTSIQYVCMCVRGASVFASVCASVCQV